MARSPCGIPEDWLEDRTDDWTPTRGLIRGSMWTAAAGVIAGGMFCLLSHFAPRVTSYFLLAPAWGFVLTWILFSVMHRTSGMISLSRTVVVVFAVFVIFTTKQVVVGLAQGGDAALWSLMSPWHVFIGNLFAWIGVSAAALMCRDGDSIMLEVADVAMSNVFTGRR